MFVFITPVPPVGSQCECVCYVLPKRRCFQGHSCCQQCLHWRSFPQVSPHLLHLVKVVQCGGWCDVCNMRKILLVFRFSHLLFRASFGTTKYCTNFLKGTVCTKPVSWMGSWNSQVRTTWVGTSLDLCVVYSVCVTCTCQGLNSSAGCFWNVRQWDSNWR